MYLLYLDDSGSPSDKDSDFLSSQESPFLSGRLTGSTPR